MTKANRRVYLFIKDFISKKQYAPSVREIGSGVGLKSPSTVHQHLHNLRDQGYIDFHTSLSRTITIVKEDV